MVNIVEAPTIVTVPSSKRTVTRCSSSPSSMRRTLPWRVMVLEASEGHPCNPIRPEVAESYSSAGPARREGAPACAGSASSLELLGGAGELEAHHCGADAGQGFRGAPPNPI